MIFVTFGNDINEICIIFLTALNANGLFILILRDYHSQSHGMNNQSSREGKAGKFVIATI